MFEAENPPLEKKDIRHLHHQRPKFLSSPSWGPKDVPKPTSPPATNLTARREAVQAQSRAAGSSKSDEQSSHMYGCVQVLSPNKVIVVSEVY